MNLSSLTEISTPLWYIKSLTIAQQSENSIAFAVAHVSQLRSLHALYVHAILSFSVSRSSCTRLSLRMSTPLFHASFSFPLCPNKTKKINKMKMLTGLEACSLLPPTQLSQKHFDLRPAPPETKNRQNMNTDIGTGIQGNCKENLKTQKEMAV